jgi:hypothetical protein
MTPTPGPIVSIAPNLWTVDMPLSVFGFSVGTRMTIIRLGNGRLLLYSPVAIPEALRHQIALLGEVGAIVCPNAYHHLFAAEAVKAFPTARLYGPAELAPKRRDLHFDGYLTNVPPPLWGTDALPSRVQGSRLHETAIFHPESHTLLVADLLQNIRAPKDAWTRLYLWFGGTGDRPGPHRLVRWSFNNDDEARQGIRRILKWDIRRIVPCHGEILEDHAKQVFAQAYAWLDEE